MNGSHFAMIITCLARMPLRQRWVAAVFLGLSLIGAIWLVGGFRQVGSGSQVPGFHATLTDSPSWQRIKPEWPKYMPVLPPAGQTSDVTASASATPAVIYGTPTTATPLVATGPELFLPGYQPALPLPQQPQSWMGPPPPQFLAQRPVASVPGQPMAPPSDPQRAIGRVRSEAMEKISTQSDMQIRHGFELASRGAYFAARAEFTAALRLIAQGLDNDQNTLLHSQALSAALTALQEAQDFIPPHGRLEGERDLEPIVACHNTPVLKNAPRQQLQSMRALKQYHTFAQEQFTVAAGKEVSGSMALGALGKMHAALAGRANPEILLPEAKAIVFFQAAILVCPKNYMAANDLGVLLAHNGDYAGARRMLEHSVLVSRTSENLSNLGIVYRQLGDQHLSELAMQKAEVARATEVARQKGASLSAGGSVEWVDPSALAQSPGPWSDPTARSAAPSGPSGSTPSQPVMGFTPAPYGPPATH